MNARPFWYATSRCSRPARYGHSRALCAAHKEQCLCYRGNDFASHRRSALRLVCQRHLEKRPFRRSRSRRHLCTPRNRSLGSAGGCTFANPHFRHAAIRCNRTAGCGDLPLAYSPTDRRVGTPSSAAHRMIKYVGNQDHSVRLGPHHFLERRNLIAKSLGMSKGLPRHL